MVCCVYFYSLEEVDVDFFTFKLNLDENILAFFSLETLWVNISKALGDFSQYSGHPDNKTLLIFTVLFINTLCFI
jgi:hypothetical protein